MRRLLVAPIGWVDFDVLFKLVLLGSGILELMDVGLKVGRLLLMLLLE